MKIFRVFTIVSLLLVTLHSAACWFPSPTPRDNMIFRLVEDVSPYYIFDSAPYFRPENNDVSEEFFRTENIKLWRKQTGTGLSDEEIERFVYKYSMTELESHKAECVKELGMDAYDYLVCAKRCEKARAEMNDAWYYPAKDDPQVVTLEGISGMGVTRGHKFFNRYVLQVLRALVEIHRDSAAVALWEKSKPEMTDDIIRTMAERHAAKAYLKIGRKEEAHRIYARIGDLTSLYMCSDDRTTIWDDVYRANPNSPFFKDVMQSLLTHFDNKYLDKMRYCYRFSEKGLEDDIVQLDNALRIALKAIKDRRVKDKAMWYYSAAALLDVKGETKVALSYAVKGKEHCKHGTFMEWTMRVMRMYLEAQVCRYDSVYIERLADDVTWLSDMARRSITDDLRKRMKRHSVTETWGGKEYTYSPTVRYKNQMCWSDAINRILADVLAPRLKREGKAVEALLMANLGEFWLPRNATGCAHSPNIADNWCFTDHFNAMSLMADTCKADVIIAAYQRIKSPKNAMDRLVRKHGMTDKDFWCDMIGSHCMAELRYKEAAEWLRGSSAGYQRKSSTWDWYDRDPFCLKIGWSTDNRKTMKRSADYKLRFAKRMAELQVTMRCAKSADKRAEAMILYGVGLRNQSDWCWALTRYSDFEGTHNELIDKKNSQAMIDKGLDAMRNKELKAFYLHAFARNKEVMDLCNNTKIAKKLQAHCDIWRDYKKNN